MTFEFQWQDPSEMSAFKILAEGEADFKVQEVIEAVSKKTGEPMLKVVLSVTDANGNNGLVDEYILSSGPWKLKNLCWAVNRPDIYNESSDGKLNSIRLVAERGRCIIKTDKPENPKFNERSIVAKYIDGVKAAADAQKVQAEKAMQDSIPNDDIPF